MNIFFKIFTSCILILQCAFLWNNKFTLYTNLDEYEANNIIFTLLSKGIDSQKIVNKDKFSIIIDKSMAAQSIKILRDYGLPHKEFTNLGKAFSNEGIISSPNQENIKYLHALSQEIEETISNIDGVMVTRVNIVTSKQNTFGEEISPASASVFIKYHPDYDMVDHITKIKQLVSNSVSKLDYAKVSINLFEAIDFDISTLPITKDNNYAWELVILGLILVSGISYYYYDKNKKSLNNIIDHDNKNKGEFMNNAVNHPLNQENISQNLNDKS